MEKAFFIPLEYWYDTPVEWRQKLRKNGQKGRDRRTVVSISLQFA